MRWTLMCLILALAACSSDARRADGPASASATSGNGIAASAAAADQSGAAKSAVSMPTERSVFYDFDNSLVHDTDLPRLQQNARYLVAHPKATVTIQGNCDERGSDEYNVALGERRALAAKKVLESYGVADRQIEVISYGKERPRASCHDEKCWKDNRRSDLVYGEPG